MRVGDMNIQRSDMPSFSMTQLNPSHVDQALQDVLARITQVGQMGAPMQAPVAPAEGGAQ